jgi:large subunit ribosomal protein L21
MYAIVEIAGQQFKVQKDQKIFVHRLKEDVGTKISFDRVLLVDNGGKINVGAPAISGASVSAEVNDHVKGDKVIVFRKKRRKGYKKKNGHRQSFTQIIIEGIVAASAKKKAAKKEVEVEVTETAEEVKPKAKATRKPKTEE